MPSQLPETHDIDAQDAFEMVDLLNDMNADELKNPLDAIDMPLVRSRIELIRTFIKAFNGADLTNEELREAEAFIDAVYPNDDE